MPPTTYTDLTPRSNAHVPKKGKVTLRRGMPKPFLTKKFSARQKK